jgi:hypothetical protein
VASIRERVNLIEINEKVSARFKFVKHCLDEEIDVCVVEDPNSSRLCGSS